MEPKCAKGQKVKIIEVKSVYGYPKYLELKEHVNETGIVLESFFIPMRGLEGTRLEGEVYDQYIYEVRLDKDGTVLKAVVEDALVALDD